MHLFWCSELAVLLKAEASWKWVTGVSQWTIPFYQASFPSVTHLAAIKWAALLHQTLLPCCSWLEANQWWTETRSQIIKPLLLQIASVGYFVLATRNLKIQGSNSLLISHNFFSHSHHSLSAQGVAHPALAWMEHRFPLEIVEAWDLMRTFSVSNCMCPAKCECFQSLTVSVKRPLDQTSL